MGRGRRLRRGSEPTRTTNLDGIFTLNECADYIAEDKWPTIPDAVSDLGLAVGDGTLDLSWSAPSTNGIPTSLYSIEYTPSGGNAVTITTNNTSYQLTGLTNNTEYSVRVGAIIGARVNYSAAVTGSVATPEPIPMTIRYNIFSGGESLVGYQISETGNRLSGATRLRITGAGFPVTGTGIFPALGTNTTTATSQEPGGNLVISRGLVSVYNLNGYAVSNRTIYGEVKFYPSDVGTNSTGSVKLELLDDNDNVLGESDFITVRWYDMDDD